MCTSKEYALGDDARPGKDLPPGWGADFWLVMGPATAPHWVPGALWFETHLCFGFA